MPPGYCETVCPFSCGICTYSFLFFLRGGGGGRGVDFSFFRSFWNHRLREIPHSPTRSILVRQDFQKQTGTDVLHSGSGSNAIITTTLNIIWVICGPILICSWLFLTCFTDDRSAGLKCCATLVTRSVLITSFRLFLAGSCECCEFVCW